MGQLLPYLQRALVGDALLRALELLLRGLERDARVVRGVRGDAPTWSPTSVPAQAANTVDAGIDRRLAVDVGRSRNGVSQSLDLVERRGVEVVVAVLALFAHGHETVLAQHLEVLRDCRLADAEFGHEFADADLAVGAHLDATLEKAVQELASRAVGEHVEDVGHLLRVARRAAGVPWRPSDCGSSAGTEGDRMRAKPVQRELVAGAHSRLRSATSRTHTPARFAILVFAGLIAVFTVLFSLPIATTSGERAPFVDALFTAVSVICVTGLSTVDMATFWSPFGHVFVFIGVEIGGIGVLTLASILGLVISRRLGLRQKLLAAGDANPLRIRARPDRRRAGRAPRRDRQPAR